jgi:chitinase
MWSNYINPKSKQQFVNLDHETSKYDLWVKIIGGDKSDTVPGIALKNGRGLIAQTRAETLVQTLGYDGLKKYLKQNAVTHTLNRNLKLMVLKNCPEDIKESIKQAILNFTHKPLPPAKDWKAYTKGVEPIRWLSDSISIKARAESDARNYLPLHD